jgi:hypothetical protein
MGFPMYIVDCNISLGVVVAAIYCHDLLPRPLGRGMK